MTTYSKLVVASWVVFLSSFVVGYIFCLFIATPILLKKHKNKKILESVIWEWPQAEFHLQDIASKTGDSTTIKIIKILKYSKAALAISFVSFLLFTVLELY